MQRRSKRILRVIIILLLVIIAWPYLRNKEVDTFDMKVDKVVYAVNGDEIGTDSLTVWLRVDCIPTSQGSITKAIRHSHDRIVSAATEQFSECFPGVSAKPILKVGDLDTVTRSSTTVLTPISSLFGSRQGFEPLNHSGDVCIVGFRISGFDLMLHQTSSIGDGHVTKIRIGTM